jgi:hypothetical protein
VKALHHTVGHTAFPPQAISDLSKMSASSYMKLLKESVRKNSALVLGAGVSASAGLPSWPKLLERICSAYFTHWEFECERDHTTIEMPPKELSIGFADEISWTPQAVQTASAFAKGDPLLVAQQIKNCIREVDWKWLLRRALYDCQDGRTHDGNPSSFIKAISKLCLHSRSWLKAVVTYNYDDLLELCLKADGGKCVPVYSEPIPGNLDVLPVYHPHGYLPLRGGPAKSSFVLAESDYMENATSPYAWSNIVQLQIFSRFSCVFLGASMKDTALRRLLRLSRTTNEMLHFAFLPASMPICTQNIMFDSLFDQDLRSIGVRVIRYVPKDVAGHEHDRLLELLTLWIECGTDPSGIWKVG